MTKKRTFLKSKFASKIILRDGAGCFYTGKHLTINNSSIEHLVPFAHGGSDELDNLVLCLKEENSKLGDLPLIDKIKYKMEKQREKVNCEIEMYRNMSINACEELRKYKENKKNMKFEELKKENRFLKELLQKNNIQIENIDNKN